ncbi:MAG TPA: serine/threonine-protein kinase, partial [Acidobacteriota bacterium]|nr:serine/threonine-protein kinase [Acidobacteriota bacterium]
MLLKDQYQVIKKLGSGGMGEAFLALDLVSHQQVAVKLLHHGVDHSETQHHWITQHFLNEAKALRLIDHPGVVKLIETGETEDGHQFLVMEFIEGASLRSQIDPYYGLLGGFERVAVLVRQLGEALSAAHEAGVYHRDLKPENILLTEVGSPNEQIKVIDFGIATVKDRLDDQTKTTVLAGSLHYFAPEQLDGHPTAASDIFALGVIAYELVTGRTPFRPDRPYPAAIFQLSELHQAGVRVNPKDLRPSLPVAAQEIILKALSYQPTARPAT